VRESVSVLDFGAVGDGVTDDTAAIQAALNQAKTTRQSVYIPAGKYSITQIALPSGIEVYGDGIGGYGSLSTSYPYDATLLFQNVGVNDDAIVFDCPFQSGQWRYFHSYVHDFVLLKLGTTDTIGNGISARQVGLDRTVDANHVLINGVTVFERLLVRGFPENGIYFRRGAVPLYCNELDFIFNKGYGLRLDGTNYSQNIVFRNIAGDGNTAGATIYIASTSADGQVTIDGLYGEYRSDNPYGNTSGFNGAQPHGVEIGDFGSNASVYIANATQQSIVANEASEAVIYVNTTTAAKTPKITFNTCVLTDQTAATGGKNVLLDNRTGTTIPPAIPSGQYNLNSSGYIVQTSMGYGSFGGNFVRPFVGDTGVQAYGITPTVSWYESDAAADEKGWLFGPSSGSLYLRTFSDDGFAANIALQIFRTGNAVTSFQFNKAITPSGGMILPTYANNAAALAGGLVVTNLYKTATGEVRIVV
jgi:hypothetical protein